MAAREFPALGFDPAPGDAAALSSAAADVTGAGTVFSDASANVSTLNSSAWTGDAVDAFRGQLNDLPRDLDLAAVTSGRSTGSPDWPTVAAGATSSSGPTRRSSWSSAARVTGSPRRRTARSAAPSLRRTCWPAFGPGSTTFLPPTHSTRPNRAPATSPAR